MEVPTLGLLPAGVDTIFREKALVEATSREEAKRKNFIVLYLLVLKLLELDMMAD